MKKYYGLVTGLAMALLLVSGCDKDEDKDSTPGNVPKIDLKSLKVEGSYVNAGDTLSLDDTLDIGVLFTNPQIPLKRVQVSVDPAGWTNYYVPLNSESLLAEESDLANGKLMFNPGVKALSLFVAYAVEQKAVEEKGIEVNILLVDSLDQEITKTIGFGCKFGKELSSWLNAPIIKGQASGSTTANENFSFMDVVAQKVHSLNQVQDEKDTAHIVFSKLDQFADYGNGFALISPSNELLEKVYSLNGLHYKCQKTNADNSFAGYYVNRKPVYFERVTLSQDQKWDELNDMQVRDLTRKINNDSPLLVDNLQVGDVVGFMLSDYSKGLLLVKELSDAEHAYQTSMRFELKVLHK